MKLIDNWKLVATKAWSMRLIILSAALSGIEAILINLSNGESTGALPAAAAVIAALAGVVRLFSQPELHK